MKKYFRDIKLYRIILAFLLAMGFYTVMTTISLPKISSEMNGLKAFDMRPTGYSVPEANEILENLSQQGQRYYTRVQLPLDFIYPALVAVYGLLAFSYLSARMKVPGIVFMLPVLVCLFDYLENIYIYLMLGGLNSALMIHTASLFTISKSISTMLFETVLIVFIIYFIISRKVLRKKQQ